MTFLSKVLWDEGNPIQGDLSNDGANPTPVGYLRLGSNFIKGSTTQATDLLDVWYLNNPFHLEITSFEFIKYENTDNQGFAGLNDSLGIDLSSAGADPTNGNLAGTLIPDGFRGDALRLFRISEVPDPSSPHDTLPAGRGFSSISLDIDILTGAQRESAGDTHYIIDIRTGITDSGTGEDDRIIGSFGYDILHGGPGNDKVFGLANDDRISGGADNDKLFGGFGADIFVFEADLIGDGSRDIDTIYDFTAVDSIDLQGFAETIECTRVNKNFLQIVLGGEDTIDVFGTRAGLDAAQTQLSC